MCAMVGGHRGDCSGGGDPPPRGSGTLPTLYETSKKKNTRGASKGKKLEEIFKANGKRPLPLVFDTSYADTYSALGDNGSMMNTLIGIAVRSLIPPYYMSWDDVPDVDKSKILPRVESYFDIGRNSSCWPQIAAGINRTCASRYSNHKSNLHTHFNEHGGIRDVATARRNPPSKLEQTTWDRLINDIFLNPSWQNRSKKNTINRSKQKYASFQGSRSYINTRYKKMNPETKQIQGAIENWHDMRNKENRGWANELAKKHYEQLQSELAASQAQQGTGSSSGGSVNEQEIFNKVFGSQVLFLMPILRTCHHL